MSGSGKKFAEAEKLQALSRMEAGENVTRLAQEMGVRRRLLYAWRDIMRRRGSLSAGRRGRPRKGERAAWEAVGNRADVPIGVRCTSGLQQAQQRIAELERKVGQQELELDFLQQALRRVGGTAPTSAAPGGRGSTGSSKT
jgi:transposase-like protein